VDSPAVLYIDDRLQVLELSKVILESHGLSRPHRVDWPHCNDDVEPNVDGRSPSGIRTLDLEAVASVSSNVTLAIVAALAWAVTNLEQTGKTKLN
jgi:hypothetical protein